MRPRLEGGYKEIMKEITLWQPVPLPQGTITHYEVPV